MNALNIPNTLTVLRILSMPLFIIFFKKNIEVSMFIFFFAMLTDALDGIVARIEKSKTVLGAILDPLADKILIDTAFLLFSISSFIPDWAAIAVISRDVLLVLGWIIIYIIKNDIRVKPSIFGKLTNLIESITVLILFLNIFFKWNFNILILLYAVVLMCLISLIDYTIKGIKKIG